MRKIMNSNYRELVKFEIERAREYFNKAEVGIKMLSPDARLPVSWMSGVIIKWAAE